MKNFVILDKTPEVNRPIGYMLYYEKVKEFIIELVDGLDEWTAPLLFTGLLKRGINTVPTEVSRKWIEERIIPSGRQNIGSILRNHHIQEYDEMKLLEISRGRCSQDECRIIPIRENDIPSEIQKRQDKALMECFSINDENIICMFNDGNVYKVNARALTERYPKMKYVASDREMFSSVKVGVGGRSMDFAESLSIRAENLRRPNLLYTAKPTDFVIFAERNLISTGELCERLQCSKQNISYLVKTGKLIPAVEAGRERLFTRGQAERLAWG